MKLATITLLLASVAVNAQTATTTTETTAPEVTDEALKTETLTTLRDKGVSQDQKDSDYKNMTAEQKTAFDAKWTARKAAQDAAITAHKTAVGYDTLDAAQKLIFDETMKKDRRDIIKKEDKDRNMMKADRKKDKYDAMTAEKKKLYDDAQKEELESLITQRITFLDNDRKSRVVAVYYKMPTAEREAFDQAQKSIKKMREKDDKAFKKRLDEKKEEAKFSTLTEEEQEEWMEKTLEARKKEVVARTTLRKAEDAAKVKDGYFKLDKAARDKVDAESEKKFDALAVTQTETRAANAKSLVTSAAALITATYMMA